MNISDVWYLDLWGFMATFMVGFGVLFLLIGILMAANAKTKADARIDFMKGFEIFVMFAGAGILFPLLPLVLLYLIGKGLWKAFT